jgi:hypothetical protein
VFRNKSHTISTVLLSLIIVSCGGGGGGGEGGQSNAISNSSSTSGGTTTTPAYVEISSSSDSVLIETSVIISWESSDATTCSASGAWSGSKALRGTEEVTISIPGNNRFTISCSSSSSSASKYVDVEGYRIFDGITLDGYIRGADIFLDENDNFIADANENYSTSDNDGRFYDLKYYDGNLISLGGSDLDTSILLDGLLLLNKLDGFSSLKVITPITSISAFMESPSNINAALGIDSSIDITKTDPIANLGDNGVYDYLYEKGNQSTTIALTISNALNSYNSTTDTTEDYFKAIAEELELSYEESNGIIDIEDESFINKVIENLTLTKANDLGSNEKDNIKSALHAVIPIIEVKNNASATTAIQNFAFSTLQSDIKNIATGSATSSTINNYQNDIYNYIASDQNIPIEELNKAPKITSDSTFTAAENQTSIGAVTASDEDDTNLSYSLSGTDSNLINIDSSGILSFISAPNYETKSSYSITVSVTDGTNTATQSITINISDENDAPVITSSSSYNADENQTAVGIVTATDEDNDTLSYSLSGTNASALNINDSGVITFNADPNYEAQNTYSITVTVSDGSTNVTQSVTINIGNINESPVITSSASLTFNNNDDNLLVGNIEVTDPENSDLIYSLSGDDASALSINSLGELSFNGTPDKTNYTVIVSVSDGVNTVTQTITITVTSNDAPVITSSASFSVNENQTSIGTVMATDADGDTLTYSLSGTDAAAISISTNGVMTFNVAPDYEIKTTYTVTVNVSDGTNTTSQTITININDLLNEDEIEVATYYGRNGILKNPKIAVLNDDTFVVVWVSEYDIYGQHFSRSGMKLGDKFRINAIPSYVHGNQTNPDIAALNTGGFVVVWEGYSNRNFFDRSGKGVYARVYGDEGNPSNCVSGQSDYNSTWTYEAFCPKTDDVLVNVTTAGDQYAPTVTHTVCHVPMGEASCSLGAVDGGFVVSWTSDGADDDGPGIHAQRFDEVGNTMAGANFIDNVNLINDYQDDSQYWSTVVTREHHTEFQPDANRNALKGDLYHAWVSSTQHQVGYSDPKPSLYAKYTESNFSEMSYEFNVYADNSSMETNYPIDATELNNGVILTVGNGKAPNDYPSYGQRTITLSYCMPQSKDCWETPAGTDIEHRGGTISQIAYVKTNQTSGTFNSDGGGFMNPRVASIKKDPSTCYVGDQQTGCSGYVLVYETDAIIPVNRIGIEGDNSEVVIGDGDGKGIVGTMAQTSNYEVKRGEVIHLQKFIVNTTREGDQHNPDTDTFNDGGIVIVWSSDKEINAPDDLEGGIYLRIFDVR